MARTALILRASGCVVLAAALTACSGAPASTPDASVAAVASPTNAPSLEPSASVIPVPSASAAPAPTKSPSPTRSHKPLPSIDPSELDAIMTASITLVDLADADLSVTVALVDPGGGKPFDLGTYSLAFTEQQTSQLPPGTYRLSFQQPAGGKTTAKCTIDVGDGEAFTFAAIDGAVAVSKAGTTPKKPGDLFVATSPLCAR